MYMILDRNLDVCGILDLKGTGCKFYDDLRTTKISDNQGKIWGDTLTISVPYGYRETEYMTQGYHLLKQGNDGYWYCYRIYDWADEAIGPTKVKTVQAMNLLAYDLSHKIVPYKKIPGANSQQAFEYILQQTGWEVGENDFFGGVKSLEFTYGNNAQYWLDQLTSMFSVEIRAYMEVKNGQVRRKMVDIVRELGVSDGRRLEYSHDLKGLKRTGNDSQMYTKLFVYGGNDKKGNPTSISSVNSGYAFIVDDDANDLYNGGGPYLEGYITNENILNPSGLLDWGKKQLEKWNHPRFTYEVDVAYLGYVPGLGDYIKVVDFSMMPELTVSSRVIQVDESEANPENCKVTLGEYVELVNVTPTDIWFLQAKAAQAAQLATMYKIELLTPDGVDFEDEESTKNIIARVHRGAEDITALLSPTSFVWYKIDKQGIHDEEWEAAHVGVGYAIVVGYECADSTIRCSVDDTISKPIRLTQESDFQFFCKLQNDPPDGYSDWNYSVAQYAQVDPINKNIFWSQVYRGTQVTKEDMDMVDSHTITRTDMTGKFLDRMICKYGGHGAHFAIDVVGSTTWIYSTYYNPNLKQWWLVKFPYKANKVLTISDPSVVKFAWYGTYTRFNVDVKNKYALTAQGRSENVVFKVMKLSTLEEGMPRILYTMKASDFGIYEGQTYQSASLDFPFMYFTYGGTAGTILNGDNPVMYCVDVRNASIVYKIVYNFTSGINPPDDHHEPETIGYYFDGDVKYLIQGFAFSHEDPTYNRRNNMLYRAIEEKNDGGGVTIT